ncbi:S8 family serine peptidase [Jannaschia sp. Os4]|uniref:S8 family serine peptidase n=1 Tax=Jannaschia sp. Os4 TaxID=2807617 RepID=UPI001939D533|nr:S8 family serine peptidase [Jannaschia sp. Os4]MBM2576659.1 S8 family serine peptidase [Jannaschia sp. Os4]
MTTPTDPLYGDQWHFSLLGDIEAIWADYDGSGVVVAVYDDGVEADHPDLAANYDASLHFTHDGTIHDPTPIYSDSGHGTAVAGLIAAVDANGRGGSGVAHGATLVGVNVLEGLGTYAETEAALAYAANYDVMNNSWGYVPNYDDYQNLSDAGSQISGEVAIYGDVVATGRDGLGTVILQAAGNDASNASADGMNASRFTLSIAATDFYGDVADYSNWGASILVAAPAASVTTDLTGADGYAAGSGASGDYTQNFGGTSASTPITSGVVALMLEANAGLGWRDVKNILAASAVQTGSAFGGGAAGFEVGEWAANGATTWNGGGMTAHLSYGYGMVDAFAAVRMAEMWTTMHGAALTSANERSVSKTSGPIASDFDDTGAAEVDIAVSEDIEIETIAVTVSLEHSFSGDVTISLVAPDGTEVPLFLEEAQYVEVEDPNDPYGYTYEPSFGFMQSGFEWTFTVELARGMSSAGTWSVRFDDGYASDSGTVREVSLDFFGARSDDDDVYTFTQDLFDLIDVEAGRRFVSDTNGGTDWLNFAAMGAAAITADLAAGTVAFAGEADVLQLSGRIEGIVLSDGADDVVGTGRDEEMHGMRGEDRMDGGRGDDILFGGAAGDSLKGGHGDDTVDGGADADSLRGGADDDVLHGGDGADTIRGDSGEDDLLGGAGDDRLIGGHDADALDGGLGDDWMSGGRDDDDLAGGAGDDRARGGSGDDRVVGNGGIDTLNGDSGADTLSGGGGDDRLNGGSGDDRLTGGSGDDRLDGGGGDDVIYGSEGADHLIGRGGKDSLRGGEGDDRMYGGDRGDTLRGDEGDDRIYGEDGNDVLRGDAGADTLFGGGGQDTLVGGAGEDIFVFSDGFGRDVVRDFRTGADVIDLSRVAGIADYDDLMQNHVQGDDADAWITVGDDRLTLEGVNALTLLEGEFLF